MKANKPIQIVDLFAGPGGLGEGFSAFTPDGKAYPYEILISAEMDPSARKTLRLRAFRRLVNRNRKLPESYHSYLAGKSDKPWDISTEKLWKKAGKEARILELGKKECNKEIDQIISKGLNLDNPWVLIGGPPCQAYSLIGRAINAGNKNYIPEKDHRHFLYREYLRIIAKYKPAVFVMENVKGILSSKVDGELIFHKIIEDLAHPGEENGKKGPKYKLYSLSGGRVFQHGDTVEDINPKNFLISSENYGVPQKRHRVIVVGIREDIKGDFSRLIPEEEYVNCEEAIKDLPELRSGLSKSLDNSALWKDAVLNQGDIVLKGLDRSSELHDINDKVIEACEALKRHKGEILRSSSDVSKLDKEKGDLKKGGSLEKYVTWVKNNAPDIVLNHETRGHIVGDLGRYLFCSSYGQAYGGTPKAKEFPDSLAPAHVSWKSGKFTDRFRVQVANQPATTITSHISKDGHNFIHYDPKQCRSLTVREAARLQSFPDNYFFEGTRTQQYVQVGNAVPPLLANKIAKVVFGVLNDID